ncbi:hypothetical protein LT336_00771 [Spiroplasma sp. JKS002671]|uniref:hypothetical protein n=1 Tax=Spiroplasma attinicola TaxID=2904537 RepID=UPI002022A348|nr:hypothetical protein [Spiroplasma sp. JKS002671]MCL8211019.1 hypothetical protein [Spiroplasma sp. JKS002671]
MKGIESSSLLVICCEGDSSYLTEEEYFKQLHNFIRINKPKFIHFNEIQLAKIKFNKIFKCDSLINKLRRKNNHKSKFSFIAIWKDNDEPSNVQKENSKLCSKKNQLFECLKQVLREDKQNEANFAVWLLPKGWNFETYYRHHFLEPLKHSDQELKQKFKEHDHFINKVFNEENFKNIDTKLKSLDSNISLFDFSDDKEK